MTEGPDDDQPNDDGADDARVGPSWAGQRVERLRENPWELFAILGSAIFVLGWAGIIYIVTSAGEHTPISFLVVGGFEGKVYFMLMTGTAVTTSSALLWGVAALVWIRRPPSSDIDRIEVCYDTSDWSTQTRRDLEAELTSRDVPYTIERGELVVAKRFERLVDRLTDTAE